MAVAQKQQITAGLHIGRWTVLDNYILTPKGSKKWLCQCSCGTQRYVLESSLRYGGSLSCGCAREENARQAIAYEITGRTFGELTVISKAETQRKNGGIWWTCRCSCGNICDVPATLLINGRKTHCGCRTVKDYYSVDISGKKFNMLTALYPTEKRSKKGSVVWHCVCDCGKETDVDYNALVYSRIVSCGCKKAEHDAQLAGFITFVDGTSIDALKSQKIATNNTTGVKGVYKVRGRWLAKIVFQQKQYYLGFYDDFSDAVAARKNAEEVIIKGTIDHYEKWKQKADADPVWAEENPVQIVVTQNENREIDVDFLPDMKE